MEQHYSFAGVEIVAHLPLGAAWQGHGKISDYVSQESRDPHNYFFSFSHELIPPDGKLLAKQPDFTVYEENGKLIRYVGGVGGSHDSAFMRVESNGKEHSVQLRSSYYQGAMSYKTILNAIGAEHLIAREGGFIFHCAYIDVGGKAVLFTAPSGTGKSTQADLWNKYRAAEIINGDRAAVRQVDGKMFAHGIPFAGSSQYCKNRSLPIAAVVYLSQAPQNNLRQIGGYEAFRRIWEGVSVNTWDKTDIEMVSDAVQTLATQVPIFHLSCTPDESAVLTLETALRKLELI